MKILILGGTRFLGYHLVMSAVRAGHEVTIFSRGQTDTAELPECVERLVGDRDGRLSALQGRQWDAVIDTSGYVPRIVRQSAELLAGNAGHYTFVSSISAYAGLDRSGVNEESPLLELTEPGSEEVAKHYGALKALSEKEILTAFPDRALIVRPGLIVGPRDTTDRFTYWPSRIKRGGQVLAPGPRDARIQILDVRDLADWIVRLAEARQAGIYNAAGPEGILSMEELLEACRTALNPQAGLVWADTPFLLERGVGPWIEMPLWLPGVGDTAEVAGLMAADNRKAIGDGLTFRPLEETIRDTAAWDESRPDTAERKAGMSPEREASLLAEWLE
ncbi:NAD-dependent epimerase/dehydratase family protein [Cohnella candidum]|uniref:NAD-dependent epimerase/dehydratase family protein n=1 Tax=Cohnella candidum TaxID=2674991 RepID=A0A3G3JWC0_9BACL|nr:NAD-dependent epimerase/dehydratase family protein [Cohnella candidum]AYQ72532.1 NAD-dependent epimerase/dehydratase family protein [Cohnella candidum]